MVLRRGPGDKTECWEKERRQHRSVILCMCRSVSKSSKSYEARQRHPRHREKSEYWYINIPQPPLALLYPEPDLLFLN